MSKIRFGRREVAPLFDLVAWEAIEEEYGDLSTAFAKLSAEDDAAERRKTALNLAVILCNNRMEAKGETPDITLKEMTRGVPPKRLPEVRLAVIEEINRGMHSDYDQADEEPVDVVLEEIAKKQNPGG